jgi:HPt (histidine-containing phosphotransfer) domain-containing protein
MSDLVIVDRARIDEVCRGNDSLAIELIGMLLDEAEPIVAALRDRAASNDVPAVNELAHALKGMAQNVGALELRDAALRLESASAKGQAPAPNALAVEIPALATALVRIRLTHGSWEARTAGKVGVFIS